MNEGLQFGKYGLIGFILSISSMPLLDIAFDVGIAFLIGLFGTLGGFAGKFLTNYIKKRFGL